MPRQIPTDLNTLKTMTMGELAQLVNDLSTFDAANLYKMLTTQGLAATLPATALPTGMPVSLSEWSQHVRAGRAYTARSLVVAVAGKYSQCSIWNPSGSGVRVLIYEAIFGASGDFWLNELSADPSTLGLVAVRNMLLGGAAQKAVVRAGTDPTVLQDSTNPQDLLSETAGTPAAFTVAPGRVQGVLFELPAGTGLTAYGSTQQVDLRGRWRFAEVAG